ncbi:MAG: hypothetical protein JXR03_18690 [Cyclobacteriaceae bacterium]
MKKSTITIALILVGMISLSAQKKVTVEFELDPLAYTIGGASGHVALAWKNERMQLGYGQLTIPESVQNHKNVSEHFKAISFKWDYFPGREDTNQGFFFGPTVDYLFLKYENENKVSVNDQQIAVGIRGGYKFDLFKSNDTLKGLYLTPWIGFSYLTDADDIQIQDESYDRKSTNIFPTIHLGWAF